MTLTSRPRKVAAEDEAVNPTEQELARNRLLEEIEADARDTSHMTGREKLSDRVMAAMAKVPRHEFVLPEDLPLAYINRPRGIGHGQTISQPFVVALMTELLDITPEDRVLEIGTGSGYQAAVLAELAAWVYSVEVIAELAISARERLQRLGYTQLEVRHIDGYGGWPEEAPFDAIMVTAAPPRLPGELVEQLAPGGRMIVPVGHRFTGQELRLYTKDPDGAVRSRGILPVAFVPMVEKTGRRS